VVLSKLLKPTNTKRAVFFLTGDIIISIFTLYISYLLRFNFNIPEQYIASFYRVALVLIPLKVFFFFLYKLYFVSWRFFSLIELKKLFVSNMLAYGTFFAVFYFFQNYFIPMPRSALIIDFFLSILFIGFFRISKRLFIKKEFLTNSPAVIIGANEKTLSVLKGEAPYSILGVYDEGALVNSYIYGYKVLDINQIRQVKTAIITKSLEQNDLNSLVAFLKEKGIEEIKIYNPFDEKIKDISIEDLLARKPKDLDKNAIEKFIQHKKILITGAGGSIGSEICRICEKYKADELLLLDNCEYNLYSINEELSVKRKCYLKDVSRYEDVEEIISVEKPDIVIHAAAYKHVPLCELNPKSAVVNNVLGTKNCIDASIKHGVKNFILISTDKAVRPTNIMGATKRICELYAQNVDSANTKISAVRFGNVLGSSGSVVPKFKKLIDENKPLPVTHPEITRYFMLIPEACQLVLQAGSLAKQGEIFILDMGEPVKIVDLAKTMLRLYGKDEKRIIFTGLRPGEKLYEELLIDEAEKETKYESIFIAKPTKMDINELNEQIEKLLLLNAKDEIVSQLKKIVKEYKPSY